MTPGDKYRKRAAQLDARAREDSQLKAELHALAASYRRLAEQADLNAKLDLSYVTPDRPRVQQQQQQQPQAKANDDN